MVHADLDHRARCVRRAGAAASAGRRCRCSGCPRSRARRRRARRAGCRRDHLRDRRVLPLLPVTAGSGIVAARQCRRRAGRRAARRPATFSAPATGGVAPRGSGPPRRRRRGTKSCASALAAQRDEQVARRNAAACRSTRASGTRRVGTDGTEPGSKAARQAVAMSPSSAPRRRGRRARRHRRVERTDGARRPPPGRSSCFAGDRITSSRVGEDTACAIAARRSSITSTSSCPITPTRICDRISRRLAARVVAGHDHPVGELLGDRAHQRALAGVAVAAAAEHAPQPAAALATPNGRSASSAFSARRRVRVVDDDFRAACLRRAPEHRVAPGRARSRGIDRGFPRSGTGIHAPYAPRHRREPRQAPPRRRAARRAPPAADDAEQVRHVELADQRRAHRLPRCPSTRS